MAQRSHSKTETMTSLFQAISFFMSLSKTEYNGGCQDQCQDTMMIADDTRCKKFMFKTNCPVKPLYASLTSREHRETQGGPNVSLT